MLPGSATFMWRAVTLQAHQPTGSDSRISQPKPAGDIPGTQRCNMTKTAQAHNVPDVPGAKRERPDPKPSAIQCAGCAAMNAKVGRITWGRAGGVSVIRSTESTTSEGEVAGSMSGPFRK